MAHSMYTIDEDDEAETVPGIILHMLLT